MSWLRRLWRPGHRMVGAILAAAGGACLLVLLGFGWFLHRTAVTPPIPAHADGIVVLTGGEDRIHAALRLLVDGRADRLLVTGIGGGARLRDLAVRAGIDAAPLAARVTLGRGAATTYGNAAETAAWARANGVTSLIVVTAFYHTPRALTEIGRALPGVRLYAAPVFPPGMRRDDGLTAWSTLRLMTQEYGKFLAARLGLTALDPGPGPRLSAAIRGR
ncbi:MAG: YdcF family protein [Acetobacteraceae bacterium]